MDDRIKQWTTGVPVEPAALAQAENMARMPFLFKHVALMPDVHAGKGSVIGSVFPTIGALCPAAVGVDIGCGVGWSRTSLTASQLPKDLGPLRLAIEEAIPHGRTDNGGENDKGAWRSVPAFVRNVWEDLLEKHYGTLLSARPDVAHGRPLEQLGTLGAGNHFIEIVVDEEDRVGILIHSGSRGPGARIGARYTAVAKDLCKRFGVELPDPDLAYLTDEMREFTDYVFDMVWAMEYARINRRLMVFAATSALSQSLPTFTEIQYLDCIHNYAALELHFERWAWVTRKGAVRAAKGDMRIIPGSMGAKSFIVRGKGNPDSFTSCSHGAGRAMSRTEAKRRFTVADHEAAMGAIECRRDEGVLDETPAAYKDVDAVMAAQADLVEVVHTLRQVVSVKG